MKNKYYEGQKLNDYKELVSLYKNKYTNHVAFEYKEAPDSLEYIKITYSQFASDIEALASSLLKLNLKRVCLISPNRYEWFVSYLAVTTSNMVVVPLDKSLPDNEIINLIERSECDAIIYDSKYENAISESKKKIPDLVAINMNTNYKNLLSDGYKMDHSNYDSIKIDNKKMTIMLFTSGTTSISKSVMLSQEAICNDLYALSQMIKITPDDTFLSFLPLHHTFESTTTFLFGTSCGITIAICDGLKYIQKNLVEYKVTGFVCVPLMLEIMYKKIIKGIEKQHKTTLVRVMRKLFKHAPINVKRKVFKSILDNFGGKLRNIVTGGAAMDKATLQGYNDFGLDIHQGYGLTETSPVIAGENSFKKKIGSCGLPLPTVNIKIDNPDKDGIGEIIVDTPTIMLGYYKNDAATKEVIVDGWFHTGDLGYIDKDGYLFITGRKKDMIVLKNGKKIFPEEIEALINKLPYISESMVFGYVEDTKNDRNSDVVLYAKLVYNKDEIKKFVSDESKYYDYIFNDIKTKINKQMPAYKYIRKIIVTDIPLIKTTTQKIKRNEELKLINSELKIKLKNLNIKEQTKKIKLRN